MKNRSLWVFFVVMLCSAIALALVSWQSTPVKPHPMVAIQDGKTIDFSTGRPVIKDDAKQKASMDKTVKEMEEAAKGVTFTSPTAAPAPTKSTGSITVPSTTKKAEPKK